MSFTIKDVAQAAGVSPSTVSKVINHFPTISEKTVQHVQEVMKQMHYYPNTQARNFAKQTTRNIVFLTKLEPHIAFDNPHMFDIFCGVQEVVAQKEYNLSFVGIQPFEGALETVERIITQKSADGIVVHGSVTTKDIIALLVKTKFPHIIIGKPNFESPACWIDTNHYLSGQIAAEHLCKCGHQKIAFISIGLEDSISTQRFKGFKDIMESKNFPVPENFIKFGNFTKSDGYNLANEVLESENRPQAIICENSNIAIGTVKSINAHGLKIPDDIALICFDDYPYSRLIDPPPTVVDIDVHDIGVQAAFMLFRKIKNPEFQVQSFTTLPVLIERSSTNALL